MEKKVLNETELKRFALELLNEERFVEIEGKKYDIFEEGFWDKLKSGIKNAWDSTKGQLAKLGSITKGGNYTGKDKAQAAADAQMDAEMSRRGNAMIKKLDQTLKAEFPGFPNMKNKEQFLAAISEIQRVYDSVVNATKKEKGSKGYLSPRRANNIIKSLRMYVQKLVDYDLASVYRMFNEADQKFYSENQHIIYEAAVAGPLTGTKETETEKVYKSNKAPLTLLGIGSALGAFGWIAQTDWFKHLFDVKSQIPVTKWVPEETTKTLGAIKPGQGMTQILNTTMGSSLGPNSSPEQLVDTLSKLGNGDAHKGVEMLAAKGGIFGDSAAAKATLNDIVDNPHGHGDTLGQIFKGKMAGTGKIAGDTLVTKSGGVIAGAIIKMVPKIALMTTIRTGAGYAAAKGLGGVLGPIGVGLVAAGAAVKALRVKGLKSSRMKTLKDMLMGFSDVAIVKTKKKIVKKQEPDVAAPKTNAKAEKGSTLNYTYSTPTSSTGTASYSVPGAVPQFGNASASTTQAEPVATTTAKKGAKAPAKTATKVAPAKKVAAVKPKTKAKATTPKVPVA